MQNQIIWIFFNVVFIFAGGFCNVANAERTFFMIKPDGIKRGLVGKIVEKFEDKDFILRGMTLKQMPKRFFENFYVEYTNKTFYPSMIEYVSSGPVIGMVWEGLNVINLSRIIMGATDPESASPGSIRGRYAKTILYSVVHASDSPVSAEREINLFFGNEFKDI